MQRKPGSEQRRQRLQPQRGLHEREAMGSRGMVAMEEVEVMVMVVVKREVQGVPTQIGTQMGRISMAHPQAAEASCLITMVRLQAWQRVNKLTLMKMQQLTHPPHQHLQLSRRHDQDPAPNHDTESQCP